MTMVKPQRAQSTTTTLPALGLTALRQLAAHLAATAQTLWFAPRTTPYFPLPQTKPAAPEKGDALPATHAPLVQKTHHATEIKLPPDAVVQPASIAPAGFAVQVPGPHMPLLDRNGRIVLCRLGN